MKLVLCPFIFVVLILWPIVGIVASVIGGATYGFLSPVFATFDAVGEGKENEFYHSVYVRNVFFFPSISLVLDPKCTSEDM